VKQRWSGLFLCIAVVFTSSLIVSNIIAVKLITFLGVVLPAGIIVFPVTYIFGDILTEVYGYARTRFVIWLGFSANLLVVILIKIGEVLPPASIWPNQEAYAVILGYTPRILLASFGAYLCGEFVNAYVLARLKVLTRGKWLWTRTIGSTIAGQLIDSVVFIGLAFVGRVPGGLLVQVVIAQWLFKVAYEVIATPFTYLIVGVLKKREGIDPYDYDTDFNPLKILSV
jgi:uncharacterized integral membrane protein (TIGR00697 family)